MGRQVSYLSTWAQKTSHLEAEAHQRAIRTMHQMDYAHAQVLELAEMALDGATVLASRCRARARCSTPGGQLQRTADRIGCAPEGGATYRLSCCANPVRTRGQSG